MESVCGEGGGVGGKLLDGLVDVLAHSFVSHLAGHALFGKWFSRENSVLVIIFIRDSPENGCAGRRR